MSNILKEKSSLFEQSLNSFVDFLNSIESVSTREELILQLPFILRRKVTKELADRELTKNININQNDLAAIREILDEFMASI